MALFESLGIAKNPHREWCVPRFTAEVGERKELEGNDELWGCKVRRLTPARLTTAWLMNEDPLMTIAGGSYKNTEVRDKTFELQEEAIRTLRGNRKLTKAKMGDALAAVKPTTDQTKIVAAVLYGLKRIQTVCFDEKARKVWTMPEDLRAWSVGMETLWVNEGCTICLETGPGAVGLWLSQREAEGWKIEWPQGEGTMEELKAEVGKRGLSVHPLELGAKVKKEDYVRVVGRAQAVEHLAGAR